MTSGGNTNSEVPRSGVPDGGYGWIIVFSSFMIHFIMDGITYTMGDVFLEPMIHQLNSNRAFVSAIFAILPAITLGSGPIATIVTNSYGCRKVTMVGAVLAALGFLISYFWANLWFYYFSISIVAGIGFGLIYLPAIVSVGFYFERKRSMAMGIAVCGSGLGTLFFAYVMPLLVEKPLALGYNNGLLIESTVIAICVIFGLLMVPLPEEPSEKRRIERKSRLEAKRSALNKPITLQSIDEQKNQLLPTQQENLKVLEDPIGGIRESSAVVPGDIRRLSLSDLEKQEMKIYNPTEEPLSRSSEGVNKEHPSEESVVLMRKDALYQGSIPNIPLYNEDEEEYRRQVITTTSSTPPAKVQKKSFFQQLAEQIDLNLLKDPAFALFAASNFLTSLGFNVPYIFAKDLANDANVHHSQQSYVLMSLGIANCFGRVIIGFLGDRKWVNRLTLYNATLIIAGAALMVAPFCNSSVFTHMTYASLFGFFSGGYVGLTSIVTVDLVGVLKLTDAFGVLLLFQGVAVAIGSPICGALRDAAGKDSKNGYFLPFMIFGGSVLISGLMLFAIPVLQRRKERRQQPTKQELGMGVRSYSTQNLSVPEQQQQL